MEKLLNELFEAVLNPKNEVKVEKDDNGDFILRVQKEKENPVINQIRSEIDNMDDNIFESAAEELKRIKPEIFDILQTLEDKNPKTLNVVSAYNEFLRVAVAICDKEIKECANQIQIYKQEKENLISNMK